MRRCMRKFLGLCCLLLCSSFLQAEEEADRLQLVKGPPLPIVNNVYGKIDSLAVAEVEIVGTLLSFGKAHPFPEELLDKLKAEDRALYDHATKTRTAFTIAQGKNSFYLRGLASIPRSKLPLGRRVKCRIYLLTIRADGTLSHLPLIKTIQML